MATNEHLQQGSDTWYLSPPPPKENGGQGKFGVVVAKILTNRLKRAGTRTWAWRDIPKAGGLRIGNQQSICHYHHRANNYFLHRRHSMVNKTLNIEHITQQQCSIGSNWRCSSWISKKIYFFHLKCCMEEYEEISLSFSSQVFF